MLTSLEQLTRCLVFDIIQLSTTTEREIKMNYYTSKVELSEDKSSAILTVKVPLLVDALALQKIIDAFCDHIADIRKTDEALA